MIPATVERRSRIIDEQFVINEKKYLMSSVRFYSEQDDNEPVTTMDEEVTGKTLLSPEQMKELIKVSLK